MTIQDQKTIGEYVAQDFRTAAVFSKYGIDFCCKGNRSIEEACTKKDLDATKIQSEIDKLLQTSQTGHIDFTSWPLDLLADYIEKTHHRFVAEKSPVLVAFLEKLCKVHGHTHPELFEITELFKGCAQELGSHMQKEEQILFPFIKKMVACDINDQELQQPGFGSVANPIAMMKAEHEHEGERLEKIAALTSNYTPPADACNTYKVTYAMLHEFEQDLHTHIHLENNILFPQALQMEAHMAYA